MGEEKAKIRTIAPLVGQLIRRDLGKFGGHSGVDKLFYLAHSIDPMISHLGTETVMNAINIKLQEEKSLQEKTQQPTIYNKMKSWADFYNLLNSLREPLNLIKLHYDEIKNKKFEDKKEDKAINRYRKACKKVSPYQYELYWLFMRLVEINDMQRQTIPTEAFRTDETSAYTQNKFNKEGKTSTPAQSTPSTSTENSGGS